MKYNERNKLEIAFFFTHNLNDFKWNSPLNIFSPICEYRIIFIS
jgi:hypothetical protein